MALRRTVLPGRFGLGELADADVVVGDGRGAHLLRRQRRDALLHGDYPGWFGGSGWDAARIDHISIDWGTGIIVIGGRFD